MSSFEPQKFERYLTWMNESIDKLTVNRSFQRIFEDIEKRMNSSELSIRHSTDSIYGTARFSNASSFEFSEDNVTQATTADYYDRIMTTSILKDYARSLKDTVGSTAFHTISSEGHATSESNNYWIKSDCCNVDFNYLPNGVGIISGTLEIGFNNLYELFNKSADVLSGDVMSTVNVSGYDTYIRITDEDSANIDDYINYSEREDKEDVLNLKKMDGVKISIPFKEPCGATVKQNICDWTTYSSFKQSLVELHFMSKIDLKSLYEGKYGTNTFDIHTRKTVSERTEDVSLDMRHPPITFEQKPLIMMQIGFYGDDSIVKPLFGFNNINSSEETKESEFNEYDTISETPLTVNGTSGSEKSPFSGMVMVKDFENIYNDDGLVTNNILNFDIIMKFSVGSAADPKMIYGLTTVNSRAKVQFAIIGV